jgi:hypothetical protein
VRQSSALVSATVEQVFAHVEQAGGAVVEPSARPPHR